MITSKSSQSTSFQNKTAKASSAGIHVVPSAPIGDKKPKLRSHKDLKTTMIYTHVLNKGGHGVRSPFDGL